MLRCGLALVATLGGFVGCQQPAAAQPASRQLSWRALSVVTAAKTGEAATAPASNGPSEVIPPLPERKSAQHAPVPDVWQPAEIEAAKARCTTLLKEIEAVAIAQPPLKEGRCGTPAPIRLISLGSKPRVQFSPPALVNCDLAVALHQWLRQDLQPLAKEHLGAPIVTIEVMSDYSCRTSSGRSHNRLSEHAFADALDIRGFVTQKGQSVHVLDLWGTTQRDIAAAEAAKMRAEKMQTAASAADKAAQRLRDAQSKMGAGQSQLAAAATKGGAGLITRTRSDGSETFTVARPGRVRESLKLAAARLGGPPDAPQHDESGGKISSLSPAATEAVPAPAPGPRSRFLREAHAAACRIFGTTLGPEANEAHRNHFHVDMAERKYKKICD